MQLTLRELRSILREAVGDRGWEGDKAHLICYVLSRGGRPMSRPEVMRQVERIEGKDPASFHPAHNNCYWSPATMIQKHLRRDAEGRPLRNADNTGWDVESEEEVPNTMAGHAARFSVLRRGLVQRAGKRGKEFLYALTSKGEQFAAETAAMMRDQPELFANPSDDSMA